MTNFIAKDYHITNPTYTGIITIGKTESNQTSQITQTYHKHIGTSHRNTPER